MYRRIIVGFDGSEGGEDAVVLARLLADRNGAELVVAGVVPNPAARRFLAAAVGGAERDVEADVTARVTRAAAEARARPEVVASGSPAHGLHDLAQQLEADAVVIGSSASRAKAGHVRAGRTALQLLSGSPAAVALAPAGYRYDHPALRVLGVAIDGSEQSLEALRSAVALADGATLRLMSVAVATNPVGPFLGYGSWGYGLQELAEAAFDNARHHLEQAVAEVPTELRPQTVVLDGHVPTELRAEAEKGVDLLCLGSRAFGPLRRVLLGSVSASVVRDAPCPVLVVPRVAVREFEGEQAASSAGAST
jgi:nucleotide-binding universal stress UspA family protein